MVLLKILQWKKVWFASGLKGGWQGARGAVCSRIQSSSSAQLGLTGQCLAVAVPWHSLSSQWGWLCPECKYLLAWAASWAVIGVLWEKAGCPKPGGYQGLFSQLDLLNWAPVLRPSLWRNYSKKQYGPCFSTHRAFCLLPSLLHSALKLP